MVKKILLAQPRGFCAGVDRAIDIVEAALEVFGAPIYVKHAIVHNIHVVSDLEKKGAIFVEDLNEIPNPKNLEQAPVVVFSAHGSPPAIKEEARNRGFKVIDATCPLVTKVHLEAKRYANEGYHIIYIGHRGHPEPIGVMGEVPSDAITLIEDESEVDSLKVPQEEKLIYLNQTTLSLSDVKNTIDALKIRFPKIIAPPTVWDICFATSNRQTAARELAKQSDLVLVIGSKTSSNSNRLRDVSQDEGTKAYLVDDETMVDSKWFKGIETVGITSGASAPEYLIENLVNFIRGENRSVVVENLEVLREDVKFPLPDDLVALARQSQKGIDWVEKHKVASQN